MQPMVVSAVRNISLLSYYAHVAWDLKTVLPVVELFNASVGFSFVFCR